MSDLPNLDAARAALEATLLPASTSTTYRAIGECGHDLGYSSPIDNYNRDRPLWCSDCGGYAGIDDVRAVEMLNRADMSVDAAFLRDALAVVDALTARLAEARKLHVGIRAALDAEAGAAAPAPWVRNDIDPKREGIAWYRRWEVDGSEPGEDDTGQTRVAWVRHNPEDMTTWCWEIEAPTRGVFGKQIAHGEGYELAYEALAACDEYAEIEARDTTPA